MISDVAKFNHLESRRRSNAFNSQIHSKEYKQACLENKHRVEKQNRAVERDRENAHNDKVNYNNIRRIAM